MKKSKDVKVQMFLEELLIENDEKFDSIVELRKIVFIEHPGATERMMYGGIMFSQEGEDFGGIFAYKNHISFEFSKGCKFSDPSKVLEGGGKFRRHLKLKVFEDISGKRVSFFVKQIQGAT